MEKASVADILARARQFAQPAALAVFDADGTLWADDIANTLFASLLKTNAFRPEALPALRAALAQSRLSTEGDASACFRRLTLAYDAGEADEALTFRTMVRALAGFSLGELDEAHRAALNGWKGQMFPEIAQLWNGLGELGYCLVVVSASPLWTVHFGLAACGLKASAVRAAATHVDDDVISDRLIEPMTYREGKLAIVRRDFGREPTIGFGDSRGDVAFLERSAIAVAVNPRPALIAAAHSFSGARLHLHCPKTHNGAMAALPERDVT